MKISIDYIEFFGEIVNQVKLKRVFVIEVMELAVKQWQKGKCHKSDNNAVNFDFTAPVTVTFHF